MANLADPDPKQEPTVGEAELPESLYKRQQCTYCEATRETDTGAPCAVCGRTEMRYMPE